MTEPVGERRREAVSFPPGPDGREKDERPYAIDVHLSLALELLLDLPLSLPLAFQCLLNLSLLLRLLRRNPIL